VKASDAAGEEAVFAHFAKLLGPAERNLLADDAKNWCSVARAEAPQVRASSQPLPESYRVVAEWLMGLPDSTMVNSGLRLSDATNDPDGGRAGARRWSKAPTRCGAPNTVGSGLPTRPSHAAREGHRRRCSGTGSPRPRARVA
jgi:hypothetical protein